MGYLSLPRSRLYGLNHIDARLGHQCNYGILGSLGYPIPWDQGSGVPGIWDPYSLGSRYMS